VSRAVVRASVVVGASVRQVNALVRFVPRQDNDLSQACAWGTGKTVSGVASARAWEDRNVRYAGPQSRRGIRARGRTALAEPEFLYGYCGIRAASECLWSAL